MPDTNTRSSATKPVTDYKRLYDLRRSDPLTLMRMHRDNGGPDLPLAAFLRRLFPDDGAWAEVDWEAVARSVEADAAEIERILAEYPATVYLDGDDEGDGDEDRQCAICAGGDICRTAFETDAEDVASEADAPLLDVMRWMHQNELHSNVDSIGALADAYRQAAAAMRLAVMGPVDG